MATSYEMQKLLEKERAGKLLTTSEALALMKYKREHFGVATSYTGRSQTSSWVNKNGTVSSSNAQRSATTKPKSKTTTGKPMLPGTYPADIAYAKQKATERANAAKTTPSSGTSSGASTTGDPFAAMSASSNIIPPTIPTYKMRSDEELRTEASTAAAGIYNPIMNALRQRQKDYETARQLGRTDLANQYAAQIADLKALALSAETAMKEQQTSANQAYDTAMSNLAQQSLATRNTNAENYNQLQGGFEDQMNQLGIQSQVNPAETAILRDKNWSDAMLAGMGNIAQTGMEAGKSASNSALAQLIANNASQFGSLQGQAGLTRDQALRDLDMQTLQNVMQGNVDIGKTQSDWNSKAYELMKALQETEWGKYMESNAAAFEQGATNAQLGLSAAEAANKSAADISANMNPAQLGLQTLRSGMSRLSPEKQKEFERVFQLMLQPRYINTANQWTPFGELQTGQQPSITNFIGDAGSQAMKDDAYKRAWLSLYNGGKGVISKDPNDPGWLMFRNAMDATMLGNKNYNLGNINQF